MIGVSEIVADFRIGKTRLRECSVRPLAVGANVKRLAWRVVQVGGKFAFPEVHEEESKSV